MLRNNFRDAIIRRRGRIRFPTAKFSRRADSAYRVTFPRRCVPANQINRDLTFDGVIASDGSIPVSPSTRRSIWRKSARCLCGCNYFHLRRRSLVQSFLRKDVPPLKLLEANSFPRGNFCEASRVAPLPSLSSPLPPSPLPSRLSRLLLPRHAFAERA